MANPITGTSGKDQLSGTAGDDVIQALGGDDRTVGIDWHIQPRDHPFA